MNKDQSAVRALPRAGALAATPQRLSRLCPEHDPLTLPAPRGQNHLRVNIAALGDVGASLLLGLRCSAARSSTASGSMILTQTRFYAMKRK